MTTLIFHNPNIRLGCHIPMEDTLFETFKNVIENTSLKSFQIYIAGKPWESLNFDANDIMKTEELLRRRQKYACIHGSLLYNLAGCVGGRTDPKFQRNLNNTVNSLISELDVAAGFNSGVVVHIGAAKNKEKGIFIICRTIEAVLDRETKTTKALSKQLGVQIKNKRKIILENAAGEGNKIGSNLKEIADIINGVEDRFKHQIKVCIDTAHIFGAGEYDFGKSEQVDLFYADFDRLIGLEKLEVFHLNDSRVKFGSKKDRHENLGVGYIFGVERNEKKDGDGLEGLKRFVEKAEEHKIPLIGEPPDKNAKGGPSLGPAWDYEVVKNLCNLETEFCC